MSVRLAQGSSAEHVDLDLPIGMLMGWSTDVPPAGWLICTGQQILINTYLALYNVLTANGTTFPYGANSNGAGAAGSTHFYLPDLRDRLLRSPASAGSVGAIGGSATHTHAFTAAVSYAQAMSDTAPYNTYDGTSGAHAHSSSAGNLVASASHTHTANENVGTPNTQPNLKRTASTSYATPAALASHGHNLTVTTSSAGGHDHSMNGDTTSNTSGHYHFVELASSAVTPTPVASLPAHVRLHHAVYTGVSA